MKKHLLFFGAVFSICASASLFLFVKGSSSFDPTQLTGRIMHFYATTGNVTLSGSNVTQWTDLSSNANNATASANWPTYVSSAINGQDAIDFGVTGGTTDQAFNTPAGTIYVGGRGTTVYWVFKFTSIDSINLANIFFSFKLDSFTRYPVIGYGNAVGEFYFTGNVLDFTAHPGWTATADTTTYHTYCLTYNGSGYNTAANLSLYYDKSLLTQGSGVTQQWGDANTIANYNTGAVTGFGATGRMPFAIVLDHAVSSTERTNLDNWVSSTYGI